jgi:long-chain acyl-CoA synthetase
MLENHPRYFDICWGAHRAGLVYTAMSTPPDRRRGQLHRQRLQCAKAVVASQAPWPRRWRTCPRPARAWRSWLMLDGVVNDPGHAASAG